MNDDGGGGGGGNEEENIVKVCFVCVRVRCICCSFKSMCSRECLAFSFQLKQLLYKTLFQFIRCQSLTATHFLTNFMPYRLVKFQFTISTVVELMTGERESANERLHYGNTHTKQKKKKKRSKIHGSRRKENSMSNGMTRSAQHGENGRYRKFQDMKY